MAPFLSLIAHLEPMHRELCGKLSQIPDKDMSGHIAWSTGRCDHLFFYWVVFDGDCHSENCDNRDSCQEYVVAVCDETVPDVRLGIVFLIKMMSNVNQRILYHVKMLYNLISVLSLLTCNLFCFWTNLLDSASLMGDTSLTGSCLQRYTLYNCQIATKSCGQQMCLCWW